MTEDTGTEIQKLIAGSILLLVGIMIVVLLFTAIFGAQDMTDEPFEPSIEGTTFPEAPIVNEQIVDSTGNAVGFGYQPGGVEATISATGPPMTVSAWTQLNESAATWRDYQILTKGNGTITIQYLSGEWQACYTDVETTCATGSASDPHELTHIGVVVDDNLRLYEGSTLLESTALDGSGSIAPTDPLYGTIEEVRLLETALDSAELQEFVDDPVGPAHADDTVARLMFDEGAGDETRILYEGGYASLTGSAHWTDGLEGSTLVEGEDYELDRDSAIVTAIDGSRLASLPQAFITYDTTEIGGARGTALQIVSGLGFFSIVILAGAAVLLLSLVSNQLTTQQQRGGRR